MDTNVREAINQGFVRAEIASGADKKADRVYGESTLNPVSLDRFASSAEANYMAAISCFLRTLPRIADPRSNLLIRTEIDRLLTRLEAMRRLRALAEAALAGAGQDELDRGPVGS